MTPEGKIGFWLLGAILISTGTCLWVLFNIIWWAGKKWSERKLDRRHRGEFRLREDLAPYMLRALADKTLDYTVSWSKEELISYRPPKCYDNWLCSIKFDPALIVRFEDAFGAACRASSRDEEREQDERWERQYREKLEAETEACKGANI